MRKKLIIGLAVLNGLFAFAVFAPPAQTQIIPFGIRNCCEGEGEDAFCCSGCCWFFSDCDGDDDCNL